MEKTKKAKIPIYLMPGMAASPKIFEYIELPEPFEIHCLSWIPPKQKETLGSYALRMCERIEHHQPILLGVSFGGVLVQEMAKHITVRNTVIVSSIKSDKELPLPMKMAQKTNAHKLLPTKWINNLDHLALFAFGEGIKKRLALYQRYLSERNPEYLSWAIDTLVNWKQELYPKDIIHVHGLSDTVFPVGNLEEPFIKIKGGHAAVITHAKWFNENLPKLLL